MLCFETEVKNDGDAAAYIISTSGLVGYLVGLRRSLGARLGYMATGVIGMSIVCYPKQARNYNQELVAFIEDYIKQGIHLLGCGKLFQFLLESWTFLQYEFKELICCNSP